MAKFHVANLAQKLIFHFEMQGQCSDGMWENTNPSNHWHYPCSIKFHETEVHPDNIGIDCDAPVEYSKYDRYYRLNHGYRKVHSHLGQRPKKSYCFNNKELLTNVGERIITAILVYLNGNDQIRALMEKDHWIIPDSIQDFDIITEKAIQNASNIDNYYVKKYRKLNEAGLTRDIFARLLSGIKFDETPGTQYNIKNLRQDCAGLSKCWKAEQHNAS